MTFVQAIRTGFERFFDFEGRSRRTEYWYWQLFWFVVLLSLYYYFFFAWAVLFLVVTVIPYLALTIRRLHDLNKSGWWILLLTIPVMGFFTYVTTLLFLLILAIVFLMVLWLTRKGDRLMNRYGESPLSIYYESTQY